MPKRRLVLVNLGTPAEPTAEAVRAFLAEFLSDPLVVDYPAWLWQPILRGIVLRSRPRKVARLYGEIWGPAGSPLREGTERIAAAVARELGEEHEVLAAYRYGSPGLLETLSRPSPDGGRPDEIAVLPLFPQRTQSSSGTIEALVRSATPDPACKVRLLALSPEDPDYIEAVAASCRATFESAGAAPEHLVVSFHGIPVRHDTRASGGYRADCERTFRALLARLEWPIERATLAFQSRFGPDAWLEPATAPTLERLARAGVRRVAVTTPGFLTEGLETLEEIGVQARALFRAAGGEEFLRVPCVEDHPSLVRALAALPEQKRSNRGTGGNAPKMTGP